MQLKTKAVGIRDGMTIIVHEADGSFDSRLNSMETEAKKIESTDKTFIYFATYIYPLLYSCTSGEAVPSAQEAYGLPSEKLDEWYLAFWELNPDIITRPITEPRSEEIEFRDETKFIIQETRDQPSYMLRLHRLEQDVQDNPPADPDELSFRIMIYPKIAACVREGVIIPSAEEACKFPRTELSIWTSAAMRMNPSWFAPILSAVEEADAKKEQVKKKRRSRPANRKTQSVLQG